MMAKGLITRGPLLHHEELAEEAWGGVPGMSHREEALGQHTTLERVLSIA